MNKRQYSVPMRGNTSIAAMILAIAVGMGGELHIQAPGIGVIAMFDLVSYFIAVPALLMSWGKMGRFMRQSLKWAFAWTIVSMIANTFHFLDMRYWLKCVSLASSSWAIMTAAYVLLRNDARLYLWYLVGAGIGGWIALYHFRNGAIEYFATRGDFGGGGYGVEFLMDKQIYPTVAKGILWGMCLPVFIWWRKFPTLIIMITMVVAGFWLLFNGGSRSSFGCWCGAAMAGFCVLYAKRVARWMTKHAFVFVAVTCCSIALVFGGYKYLAKSGMLGEGEAEKYEYEFGEEGRGAVIGRASFDSAIESSIESYGIGLGGHLRCHSVMANSLACEGFVGFLFWAYFYYLVYWWCVHRLPYSSRYSSLIVLMILVACWAVFGSPFGTRHKFFVLMAFIDLCRDKPFYGVGSIFDPDMIHFNNRRLVYGKGVDRRCF